MKKQTALIILFIHLALIPTFAQDHSYKTQRVFGYIDDIIYLSVSPYKYANTTMGNYTGIDLDYNDENNGFRYLIQPSQNSPGLQVGSFSILATFAISRKTATLTVTHSKLTLVGSNPAVAVDYELGIKYAISDGTGISNPEPSFCLSTSSIVLHITSQISTVMDGSIYFRLASGNDNKITEEGQYASTVTFFLEVD